MKILPFILAVVFVVVVFFMATRSQRSTTYDTPTVTSPAVLESTASPSVSPTETASPTHYSTSSPTPEQIAQPTPTSTLTPMSPPVTAGYPWHTNITATVFWIGEPQGGGSSEDNAISAYDDNWQGSYGGFDDYSYYRSAEQDYFPSEFTPKENPFYLDLPFDDVNNATAYQWRSNIPWYTGTTSKQYSYMKNRWVQITKGSRTCYGQIEDAGPYVYNDYEYVFGQNDERPKSGRANNAGMDVSPALRDCLGFEGLNNASNTVDWRFIDAANIPDGPWSIVVTTSQVNQ